MRVKEYLTNLFIAVVVSLPLSALYTFIVVENCGKTMLKAAVELNVYDTVPDDLYNENMCWFFVLTLLLTLIIPYSRLSRKLTGHFNISAPSILYYFLYSVPPVAGNVTIIDFLLSYQIASKMAGAAVEFQEMESMSLGVLLFDFFVLSLVPTVLLGLFLYVLFGIIKENFLEKWLAK